MIKKMWPWGICPEALGLKLYFLRIDRRSNSLADGGQQTMKKKYSTNWDTVLYPKLVTDLGHFNVLDWEMDKIACKPCSDVLVSQGSQVSDSFIGQNLICPICEKEINDAK